MPTITKKPVAKKNKEIVSGSEDQNRYFYGVGRRKTAIAQVRLYPKHKTITVNGKDYHDYFPTKRAQLTIEAPFKKMKTESFGGEVKLVGGGVSAQAEAVRHGISRALLAFNPEFKRRLKRAGYLTRDPRMVERKKYGLKKARRAPQWGKR
ncbi:MAG: 30S ribosomal protein S9 [Patescibacteria group bacterium]|nr:30S ribosomal protein S9 [Patescibacteria group bacterium]MDE2437858.1 30S ribosomal protein S9 [Patescibacteria group bacterium]